MDKRLIRKKSDDELIDIYYDVPQAVNVRSYIKLLLQKRWQDRNLIITLIGIFLSGLSGSLITFIISKIK